MQFLDRIQIKERHLETVCQREGGNEWLLCVGRRVKEREEGSQNGNKEEWKTKAISSFELTEPNQSVWK